MSEGVARFYFRRHIKYFNHFAANPEVGHGMIKILKSLNFRGIAGRDLSNELRRDSGVNDRKGNKPIRTDSSGALDFPAKDRILKQLEEPVPEETEKAAKKLRKNIEDLPERGRLHLVASLKHKHVLRMWKIAGYNLIDCAADMLPSVKGKPPVRVKGKIHRNSGNWLSPSMGNIFGNGTFKMTFSCDNSHVYGQIKGGNWLRNIFDNVTFKMTFSCDNNSHVYGQIKGGMKGSFHLIREDANGDSLCKKPCHLTFEYRNGDQRLPEHYQKLKFIKKGTKLFPWKKQVVPLDDNVKQAEQQKQFMDKLLSIRCAGPNLLVGQTPSEDESVLVVVGQARPEAECISAEIVLLKKC